MSCRQNTKTKSRQKGAPVSKLSQKLKSLLRKSKEAQQQPVEADDEVLEQERAAGAPDESELTQEFPATDEDWESVVDDDIPPAYKDEDAQEGRALASSEQQATNADRWPVDASQDLDASAVSESEEDAALLAGQSPESEAQSLNEEGELGGPDEAAQPDASGPKLPVIARARQWVADKRRQVKAAVDAKKQAALVKKALKAEEKLSKIEHNVPVRLFIGFLPEVAEKDAREFAKGVASKRLESLDQAYIGVFPYDNGFAYEVHEGGHHHAYIPTIIERFKSLGPFSPDAENTLVLRSATRAVEVRRQRNGLSALLLVEGDMPAANPEWARPSSALKPVIAQLQGTLIVGSVIFVTGFMAMIMSGFHFRIQPYDNTIPTKIEKVSVDALPYTQLAAMANLPETRYVKSLKFNKGAWAIDIVDVSELEEPPAPLPVDGVGAPVPPDTPAQATIQESEVAQ